MATMLATANASFSHIKAPRSVLNRREKLIADALQVQNQCLEGVIDMDTAIEFLRAIRMQIYRINERLANQYPFSETRKATSTQQDIDGIKSCYRDYDSDPRVKESYTAQEMMRLTQQNNKLFTL